MKLFKLYSYLLVISLVITAHHVTSLADYTIQCGFVLHKEHLFSATLSTIVTAIMFYYYKVLEKKLLDNSK